MDDLIEFLRARLAEDEAVARAAAEPAPGLSPSDPVEFVISGNDLSTPATVAADAHIRRFAPARLLAEVEGKQRLLNYLVDLEDKALDGNWWNLDTGLPFQLLARAYAAHPDYRPEWAPEGSST